MTQTPDTFTTRYATPADKVKAYMEELDRKVESMDNDEDWLAYLSFVAKFHHYSLSNQLLILIQRPDATRVAGYRKWEEMGRHVRKGEHGISILAPRTAKVPDEERDESKPKYRVIGYTTVSVFDIAQTDGADIPTDGQTITEDAPEGLIDDLIGAIMARGFSVSYEAMSGGREGYTTTDDSKRVVVREGLNDGSRARVLAHELGHIAAGHIERAEEYHTGHGGQRRQMEVEADSISYVLLRANGMSAEVGGANARYVAGWQGKDKETVKQAAQNISKAVKSLLDDGEWRNA